MLQRDSIAGTITVAATLCVFCSIIVSSVAVGLNNTIEENKTLDKQKNVLAAAGLLEEGDSASQISKKFQKIERQIINLNTGEIASDSELDKETFNQKESRNKPELNQEIPKGSLPGYSTIEKFSEVYLVKSDDGKLQQVVLPIYGKGLWSTLEGFLAIQSDLEHSNGITFYSHGETPGLGGEVDSDGFKEQWLKGADLKLRDEAGDVTVHVKKAGSASGENDVDGLSGATITTKGVNDLVRFWLGENGFGPYLEKLEKEKEKSNG